MSIKYPLLALADIDNRHPKLDTVWAQILLSIHHIFYMNANFNEYLACL